jgi:inhibitor of cysteine peptidase
MEKKIKKRAQLYGVAAVLLAIILGALCYNLGGYPPEFLSPPSSALLGTFSSYEELRSFLTANSKTQGAFPFYGPWDFRILAPLEGEVVGYLAEKGLEFEYSTTNIQVAGVDEADIVKTDGERIYLVSGNNVSILKAYPPEEAEVLSKITFNDTYPVGIFVSGDRLAVLGCKYTFPSGGYYRYFCVDVKTFVNVYDISNEANPTLLRNFTMSGSYFNSRMIGEYVYFVVSQPAYVIYDTVILPKIYSSDEIKEISASEIHYSNASDNYYMYTTVVALNMQNTEEEPAHMTIMLGGTSSMYVSLNNIYITFPEPDGQTSVYRIRIENSTISSEAHGKVPGRELNQFSMDEYNNYFRIATTTWINGNTQNNVYILDTLDVNLSIVGSLTNIAPGEAIDSARFIGNRCYLATSVVQKDPFFVIDVENASDPKILGYLKIPGFTRYLHPYDKNHMIGIGKDENNNVKISLFDVSNVSAPIEKSKYTVKGTWSDTLVLTEHKAFLFDKSKELLAIPVLISSGWDKFSPWQGAYVFSINLSDGLVLRGNVTHREDYVNGWESSFWVKRAVYIENVLYTISDKKIEMNSLEDLAPIEEIELP